MKCLAPVPTKLNKNSDIVYNESPPGFDAASSENVYMEESFVSDTLGCEAIQRNV